MSHSDRLTDEQIAALEAAEKAADPAPWHLVGKPWMDDDQCDTYAISGNTDPHAGVPVLSWVEPDLRDPESEADENEHKQRANLACAVAARNALPSLLAEVRALRECVGEAEEVLAPFMLMCSAWDGLPAETVVAEVGVQSIRVSAFREARDFWLGRLKSELDRAALAGVRALREGESDG